MNDHEFKTTSKELLLEGAKLCHKNAQVHYDAAQTLADLGAFGIANSHVILSSEECIKSMILLAGFYNVELPFKIEPFFWGHLKRHQQAAEIQPFIEDLCMLGDIFNAIFKARRPSSFGMTFDVILSVAMFSIFNSITKKEARDFSDFWKKANDMKNNGFYVDFREGSWISPQLIDKNEFLESKIRISPFLRCLEFIEQVRPNDYKEIDIAKLKASLEPK